MKSLCFSLIIIAFLFFTGCNSRIDKQQSEETLGLALTPPMGWNTYNSFGVDINSQMIMDAADAMVASGMAEAGYEYIVIDDGWQIDRDENGRIVVDSIRFPEGMKFLGDYIHSRGLKFGIYTDLGTMTCASLPGSYGYEEIDAQTYAEWGVDFIKADWCFSDGLDTRTQYKIMSDAIKATGRPMVFSICEWGTTSPWEWGKGVGHMWRTTNDIQDCYDCIRWWGGLGWIHILEVTGELASFAGPGYWNDPDMLMVGNNGLTVSESVAHFAMWCMLAAPLMAGNDLSKMNDTIRAILTAPELIAINQDPLGIQGSRIRNDDGLQVWQKPLRDGSVAVSLLNTTESDALMHVTLEEIGFRKGRKSKVRDAWKREDLPDITDRYQVEVEARGIVVVIIKGENAPVSFLEFDQSSVTLNEGNHKLLKVKVVPSVTSINVSSSNNEILSVSVAGVNTFRLSAHKAGEVTLTVSTVDGKHSSKADVIINPSNLPKPWKFVDIDNNKSSAVWDAGVFIVDGAGRDIWGAFDQFAFVKQEVNEDSYISARILSQTDPDPWAKSGVMIRESDARDSRFVMINVTPGNGLTMQWRELTADPCKMKNLGEYSFPLYLKLLKNGTTFQAFKSKNGDNWELIGEVTLGESFVKNHLVGLNAVAHSGSLINVTKFDQVVVSSIE
jgi:alpha-galactosidase